MNTSVFPKVTARRPRGVPADEVTRLTADELPESFGTSVAVSADGQTVVVGAPHGAGASEAYAFARQGAWWQPSALPLPDDVAPGYAQAVAISGNSQVIAVSALGRGGVGAVYLYETTSSGWIHAITLDMFGVQETVATTLLLNTEGTVLACTSGRLCEVLIFVRNNDGWNAAPVVLSPEGAAANRFGACIALSGDGQWLAASHDYAEGQHGQVHLFNAGSGGWAADCTHRLIAAPTSSSAQRFSSSLSLDASGLHLAVGSAQGQGGVVYVFERHEQNWSLAQTLKLAQPTTTDQFGATLAFNADASSLLVGAPGLREGNASAGAVLLHRRSQGLLGQPLRLALGVTGLGVSLAISADGQTCVAGAPADKVVYLITPHSRTGSLPIYAPKYPGIGLQETSTPNLDSAPVLTAIPVFIGRFRDSQGELASNAACIAINNAVEFDRQFGASQLTRVQYGTTPIVTHELGIGSHSVRHYFDNGGARCYILPVADASDTDERRALAEKIRQQPEITLLCTTEFTTGVDPMYEALDPLLAKAGSPFLIADSPDGIQRPYTLPRRTAVYFPGVTTTYSARPNDEHIEVTGYVFASGTPAGFERHTLAMIGLQDPTAHRHLGQALDAYFLAHYPQVNLKASPSVAAVYARTDRDVGVWRAPAGPVLNRVRSLYPSLSMARERGLMGQRINALHDFPNEGVRVWGSRTQVDPRTPQWLEVPVCRLFDSAARDLQRLLHFAVYLPNNASTWTLARAAAERYLERLWRHGGLHGRSRDEAFYVQIGSDVSMNADDLLAGRMVLKVGMAVLRPLEFIEVVFSQVLSTGE